jgi:hypothetical protein
MKWRKRRGWNIHREEKVKLFVFFCQYTYFLEAITLTTTDVSLWFTSEININI